MTDRFVIQSINFVGAMLPIEPAVRREIRLRRALACSFAALVGGLLYLNALHNPFVYDDYQTVVDNLTVIIQRLTLPEGSPYYMPITRELSPALAAKFKTAAQAAIAEWEAKSGAEGREILERFRTK